MIYGKKEQAYSVCFKEYGLIAQETGIRSYAATNELDLAGILMDGMR